jgi:hypothetical protein
MSKTELPRFDYLTLEYKYNREKHIIFCKDFKNRDKDYPTLTLNDLGNDGWELIQQFEDRQTDGQIGKRVAVFIREQLQNLD